MPAHAGKEKKKGKKRKGTMYPVLASAYCACHSRCALTKKRGSLGRFQRSELLPSRDERGKKREERTPRSLRGCLLYGLQRWGEGFKKKKGKKGGPMGFGSVSPRLAPAF